MPLSSGFAPPDVAWFTVRHGAGSGFGLHPLQHRVLVVLITREDEGSIDSFLAHKPLKQRGGELDRPL